MNSHPFFSDRWLKPNRRRVKNGFIQDFDAHHCSDTEDVALFLDL